MLQDFIFGLKLLFKQRAFTAAALLTSGRLYETVSQQPDENPEDTGEALGLGPSQLTLTFGFGPGLFGSPGRNPLVPAPRRPTELAELPPFKGERLDAARSGGLAVSCSVQACWSSSAGAPRPAPRAPTRAGAPAEPWGRRAATSPGAPATPA